ncbi:MAG: hypothetical protein AAGL18_05950 [Pseudomonadota bacterium]
MNKDSTCCPQTGNPYAYKKVALLGDQWEPISHAECEAALVQRHRRISLITADVVQAAAHATLDYAAIDRKAFGAPTACLSKAIWAHSIAERLRRGQTVSSSHPGAVMPSPNQIGALTQSDVDWVHGEPALAPSPAPRGTAPQNDPIGTVQTGEYAEANMPPRPDFAVHGATGIAEASFSSTPVDQYTAIIPAPTIGQAAAPFEPLKTGRPLSVSTDASGKNQPYGQRDEKSLEAGAPSKRRTQLHGAREQILTPPKAEMDNPVGAVPSHSLGDGQKNR